MLSCDDVIHIHLLARKAKSNETDEVVSHTRTAKTIEYFDNSLSPNLNLLNHVIIEVRQLTDIMLLSQALL